MTKTTAHATITQRPGFTVRATLAIKPALPRGAHREERRMRDATLAATAYRLAAWVELLRAESGTSCAIDIDAHDGVLTLELAKPTTDFQAFTLMTQACEKTEIFWTGPRG